MESFSGRKNAGKMWRTIRRLSGRRKQADPNQPISFGGSSLSNKKEIANKFVKQFTRPTPHRHNPNTRKTIRKLRSNHPLNHQLAPFTPSQVRGAIQISGNSTAPSPDGLTIHHLKHLGPLGIRFLCKIFNLSYAQARFPDIWMRAITTPLLKP